MAVDDSYTKVLLHMDGSPGGTTFTDESGKTWTPYGNANTFENYARFGTACLYCDGTGDWIDTPDHSDFTLGTGEWTVDFWFRTGAASNQYIFGQSDASLTGTSISIYGTLTSTGIVRCGLYTGATPHYVESSTSGFNNSFWHHVLYQRKGDVIWLFIDGRFHSNKVITGVSINDSSNKFAICRLGEYAADTFNGSIDEFRLSKGIARGEINYTVPSSQQSKSIRTRNLLYFNGSDGSTTFTDETGKTWTAQGNAQLDTAQKKFGTASLLLDGTGDYITTPDHLDFKLGQDDFTIEMWVRFNSTTGKQDFCGQYVSPNWQDQWVFYKAATTHKLGFVMYSAGVETANYSMASNWSVSTGTWYHISVVRNGTFIWMFIDGISQGLTVTTGIGNNSLANVNGALKIGVEDEVSFFNGWIDDFRFTKGALYGGFSPPTTPYGQTSTLDDDYTIFLSHFNGGDVSLTSQTTRWFIINQAGNAQLDTAQKKFGTASMLFDGTGDYTYVVPYNVSVSDTDLYLPGDFTIDFWVRFNSITGSQNMIDFRPPSISGLYPCIFKDSGNNLVWYINAANRITGTTSVTTSTWYHVAVARSGSSTKMFLDGVQEGSTYTDTNAYLCGHYRPIMGISGYDGTSAPLNGWLDEMRISKGIARWTTNFTPPTKEYGPLVLGKRFRTFIVGV